MTSIQQGKSRHGQTIKAVFVFRVFNCIQQWFLIQKQFLL